MEPFSAIILLAAKHGVGMVVAALAGDDKVGGAAGELFAALTASESRLDQRLAGIEAQLAEALDQRHTVALGNGARYLFEAGLAGDASRRAADLERARTEFIDASNAARSSLQQASAERYLLLVSLATGRAAAAAAALPDLEAALFDAALEAKTLTVRSADTADRILRAQGGTSLFGRDAAVHKARLAVQDSAGQALRLVVGMLSEAAVLAQALGLPGRLDPLGGVHPMQPAVGRWDIAVPHGGCRVGNLGCRFTVKGRLDRGGLLKTQTSPIGAELTFDPPLRRPVIVQVQLAEGPPRTYPLAAGATRCEVPFDSHADRPAERGQRIDIRPHEQVDPLVRLHPHHESHLAVRPFHGGSRDR